MLLYSYPTYSEKNKRRILVDLVKYKIKLLPFSFDFYKIFNKVSFMSCHLAFLSDQ